MRHQIPTFLAITLVLSISLLMGRLVVNQSESIQADYAEAGMYDVQTQAQKIQLSHK